MNLKKYFDFNKVDLLYLPALLLFFTIIVIPFFLAFKYSFTNWDGFSQTYQYIGLDNYFNLFKDENLPTIMGNTLWYGLGSTFFQQILGLSYALLLNSKFTLNKLLWVLIYLPIMIAGVILGHMWFFIFQYDEGALNDLAMSLGFEPQDWLVSPNLSRMIMVAANTLQFTGVSMIICLAGLKSIPSNLYDVANIDAINKWAQFRYITLPLLKPAIISSVILNVIGGLKLFDIIVSLTDGGPGFSTHSFSTYITYSYFFKQQAGYSATVGLLLFFLIISIAISCYKFLNRNNTSM